MAKSKTVPSEQKAQAPKENKVIVPAAEAKKAPAKKVDPNEVLSIDGSPMLWKSRTYVPGIGLVSGPVKVVDFETFSDQVKHLKTDPREWISTVNEVAAQLKARQKEAKLRNGLS